MPIEEVRQKIEKIDNSPSTNDTPYISDELRESAGLRKLKNSSMSKSDWDNSKQEFLEEIKILLLNIGKEERLEKKSSGEVVINIDC